MLRLQLLGGIQLAAPDGRDLRPLVGRPKRFAVLAYLAAQGPGNFVRRDVLTVLFWPEMDQSGARKAVRQALYVLRTDLGEDVFETIGDDEVRVSPERLWCDVPAFLGAIQGGRPEEALELYHGDLLPSFFVPEGAPGFEQWLEDERGRLRTLAAKAAWDLAEGAERNRTSGPATTWGRKAMALTHDDETALRRLIRLLDRMGDRAGALRAYDTFARRLKEEFGDEPSAETQAMIARVREREAPRATPPGVATPPAPPHAAELIAPIDSPAAAVAPAPTEVGVTPDHASATRARRPWPALAIVTGLVVLLGGLMYWRASSAAPVELSASTRVSTVSAVAREHYRRGLAAWYAHQDPKEAIRELEAALAEDSTFAMAAYQLVTIVGWYDDPAARHYMAQAVRMARYATPDERRLIELEQGMSTNDPRVAPLAELLAEEYPRDLAVQVKASQSAFVSGRLARSAALARRVIALDTTSAQAVNGPCPKCEAYLTLSAILIGQDSLVAAEQVIREWRSSRPDDIRADRHMAFVLEYLGRYDESRLITQQMSDRGRGRIVPEYQQASIALRQGDTDGARLGLIGAIAKAPDSSRDELRWMLASVLRNAGRFAEARRMLGPLMEKDSVGWDIQLAQIAWEAGDNATAVRLARPFLSRPIVAGSTSDSPRSLAWWLIRASTYFATAGDTGALVLAAERLEQLGQLSAMGRDQRGFHYPRALLFLARGQETDAEAELRAAILLPSEGYTRINLQLAQLLLRKARATEALPILRAALHTDMMSGSTLYVTQTELHEALGQAFAMLNQPDSARVHYDFVARAWGHSDPVLRLRLDTAKTYLRAHQRL